MIVIDTNILISALIKDSITRKIIIESSFQFAYPEVSLNELLRYKEYILKKSGYNKEGFEIILNKLLSYINLIPLEVINTRINDAKKIMVLIDINDTIFLATALALDNAPIWSEDTDFDRQKKIKTIKTKDLIKIFEK